MKRYRVMRTLLSRSAATAALVALCTAALQTGASADTPSYAVPQDRTSETIRGTVYQLTGKYTLTLQDERGFEDSITLHSGTVLLPTGVSLGAGEVVQIVGHADGKTFDADEIDVDPGSINSGQPLVPAGDYSTVYNAAYPGYAFGFDGGYYNPYYGYYGGIPSAYYRGYGGYYGGGNTYYVIPPQPSNGAQPAPAAGGPTIRRPVVPGGGYAPPGARYPAGGSVLPIAHPVTPIAHPVMPIVRPPAQSVHVAPVRSVPPPAPPAPAINRSR